MFSFLIYFSPDFHCYRWRVLASKDDLSSADGISVDILGGGEGCSGRFGAGWGPEGPALHGGNGGEVAMDLEVQCEIEKL